MVYSMQLSSQNKTQGEGSPVSRKHLESAFKSNLNSVQTPDREQQSQEPITEEQDTQESQPSCNEPFHPKYIIYLSYLW